MGYLLDCGYPLFLAYGEDKSGIVENYSKNFYIWML